MYNGGHFVLEGGDFGAVTADRLHNECTKRREKEKTQAQKSVVRTIGSKGGRPGYEPGTKM
jgi:hypothetical protein